MSIKSKKDETANAYRLKKIEDYLVSQGYVCDSYLKGILYGTRRWTDCIGNGHDISYTISGPGHSLISTLDPRHIFYVGLDHHDDYLFSCSNVKSAVSQSRYIPPDLER
jgi:hypothetical protein